MPQKASLYSQVKCLAEQYVAETTVQEAPQDDFSSQKRAKNKRIASDGMLLQVIRETISDATAVTRVRGSSSDNEFLSEEIRYNATQNLLVMEYVKKTKRYSLSQFRLVDMSSLQKFDIYTENKKALVLHEGKANFEQEEYFRQLHADCIQMMSP